MRMWSSLSLTQVAIESNTMGESWAALATRYSVAATASGVMT
jgi:hypothetical protein